MDPSLPIQLLKAQSHNNYSQVTSNCLTVEGSFQREKLAIHSGFIFRLFGSVRLLELLCKSNDWTVTYPTEQLKHTKAHSLMNTTKSLRRLFFPTTNLSSTMLVSKSRAQIVINDSRRWPHVGVSEWGHFSLEVTALVPEKARCI